MTKNTAASTNPNAPSEGAEHKPSNFLRQIIEHDLAQGTYATRKWGGSPATPPTTRQACPTRSPDCP